MKKTKILLAMYIVLAQAISAHANDGDVSSSKKTSGKIHVSVQVNFNLFSIEGRPLEGKLKTFMDEYKSKHKSDVVPPTVMPKPMVDGKLINLTDFYQNAVSKLNLPDSKKSFRDTLNIIFYLDTKGKVVPAYAMKETIDPAYNDIINQTNNIKNWSPAYFDKTPGEVAGSIQIVITDLDK